MLHKTGNDGKRVSDVEESTESPDVFFIGGLVVERPKGNDRNPEDSADRCRKLCAESRKNQRLCSMKVSVEYRGQLSSDESLRTR